MSDTILTPPAGAPTETITPVVPNAEPQTETNSTIRQMRDAIKAKDDALAALQAKVTEFERSQMTEQQRLLAELTEYKPKAEKVAQYEQTATELLEAELSAMPDDIRASVESIIGVASDPISKLKALTGAKKLIPNAAAPVVPQPAAMGGGVKPVTPPAPPVAEPTFTLTTMPRLHEVFAKK